MELEYFGNPGVFPGNPCKWKVTHFPTEKNVYVLVLYLLRCFFTPTIMKLPTEGLCVASENLEVK